MRKWELGVGVGTLRLPHYRGSDQNDVYTLPIPYVIYRGDRVSVDRSGASGWLLRTERTEVDLTLALGNPVRSAHNHAREGMPDLHVALEIGPKLVVRLAGERRDGHRWTFQWPVRVAYGFGFPEVERIGWVTNPYLEYGARNVFGTAFGVGLQAGPVFADRDYHRYYYAVDPVYARPDRPAYEARAGYGGMQYTVTLFRRAGQWWMGGFVRAYDLRGAVFEDSPLVKRDYAIYAGLAVAYVFAESEARARRGE